MYFISLILGYDTLIFVLTMQYFCPFICKLKDLNFYQFYMLFLYEFTLCAKTRSIQAENAVKVVLTY